MDHIPTPLEDITDVQRVDKRTADTSTGQVLGSGQRPVLLGGEGPEEEAGDEEHFDADEEGGGADCEIDDGDVFGGFEDLVFSQGGEDGGLGQDDADHAFEGDELCQGVMADHLFLQAALEADDGHDADYCYDRLDDADGC